MEMNTRVMAPDGLGMFIIGGGRKKDELKTLVIVEKWCPWKYRKIYKK